MELEVLKNKMEEGIVHAAFVDVQDVPCGPLSPETSEFINLERQLIMDEPNFIIGQQSPVPNIPSVQHNSSRKSSEIQREMEAEEQSRQLLQSELEEKLEERKRSMELGSSENGLQLMERRQFRQFSRYRILGCREMPILILLIFFILNSALQNI